MTESACIHVTIAVHLARSPRFSNGHAVAAFLHTTRGRCGPNPLLRAGDKTRVFFTRFVASRHWPRESNTIR